MSTEAFEPTGLTPTAQRPIGYQCEQVVLLTRVSRPQRDHVVALAIHTA